MVRDTKLLTVTHSRHQQTNDFTETDPRFEPWLLMLDISNAIPVQPYHKILVMVM